MTADVPCDGNEIADGLGRFTSVTAVALDIAALPSGATAAYAYIAPAG